MSDQLVSHLPDKDMQGAPAALLRASRRAWEIARQTRTAVVIMRDGKLVEEHPGEQDDQHAEAQVPGTSQV